MKTITKNEILTKTQIKEAKATLKSLHDLLDKIYFLENIEDRDDHTDGIAWEAHEHWYECCDALYALDHTIERIENFGK